MIKMIKVGRLNKVRKVQSHTRVLLIRALCSSTEMAYLLFTQQHWVRF